MSHSEFNPIRAVVEPLRAEAVARAERDAWARIDDLLEALESKDWDLDQLAPFPRPDCGSKRYLAAIRRRRIYESLTAPAESTRRAGAPHIRLRSPEREAKFVADCVMGAGASYDAFVLKLCAKVGPVDSAELSGSHVWGHSTLTVRKGEGVERWLTQQIVNYSKLGLVFNQWPTRRVK